MHKVQSLLLLLDKYLKIIDKIFQTQKCKQVKITTPKIMVLLTINSNKGPLRVLQLFYQNINLLKGSPIRYLSSSDYYNEMLHTKRL